MTETEYYNAGGVQVTSSRFVVGTQTYPVALITSVDVVDIPPKTAVAMLVVIACTLCGGYSLCAVAAFWRAQGDNATAAYVMGALWVLAGVGAFAIVKCARTRYAVQIVTASGQQRLVISPERNVPAAVVTALNLAIVERG